MSNQSPGGRATAIKLRSMARSRSSI